MGKPDFHAVELLSSRLCHCLFHNLNCLRLLTSTALVFQDQNSTTRPHALPMSPGEEKITHTHTHTNPTLPEKGKITRTPTHTITPHTHTHTPSNVLRRPGAECRRTGHLPSSPSEEHDYTDTLNITHTHTPTHYKTSHAHAHTITPHTHTHNHTPSNVLRRPGAECRRTGHLPSSPSDAHAFTDNSSPPPLPGMGEGRLLSELRRTRGRRPERE